jgi:hypothetical protein
MKFFMFLEHTFSSEPYSFVHIHMLTSSQHRSTFAEWKWTTLTLIENFGTSVISRIESYYEMKSIPKSNHF